MNPENISTCQMTSREKINEIKQELVYHEDPEWILL